MTFLSFVASLASKIARASSRPTKPLVLGPTRLAAGTFTLPGTRPGRPYRLGSRPRWNWGPSAFTITVPGALMAAIVSYLSTNRPGLGLALKVAVGYPFDSQHRVRRASAFHLSSPPSRTATSSKPRERSIHQMRVDHIMLPIL